MTGTEDDGSEGTQKSKHVPWGCRKRRTSGERRLGRDSEEFSKLC